MYSTFWIVSILPVPRKPDERSPSRSSTLAPVRLPTASVLRSPYLVAPWALTKRTRRWKDIV